MPEGMGGRLNAGLLGILLHDLLHPPGAELAAPPGLEQVAVLRVGGDVGAEGGGEALAEQDVAVLAALALVDEDLAVLKIDVGDLDGAAAR